MKIVIAGGTGFVGRALDEALTPHAEVLVLTRNVGRARARFGERAVQWTPPALGPWTRALEGATAVVNLSGEGVADKRWTEARKRALRASRVEVTEALVRAFALCERPPRVLINASAVGYYGPREDAALSEDVAPGTDFLARLCVDWEGAAQAAESAGVRVVLLRTGVVLGAGGGALPRMVTAFRFLAGGPVGSGRQPFSWIHAADVVGIIRLAIEREEVTGPLNVVGPEPLTMKEFSRALGRVLGKPSWLPVPGFAVRAMLGEGAEVVLSGQRAVPTRLLELGYRFKFDTVEAALRDVLART